MLVGVLAIAGTPFFSGWYSKDQIIGAALGFGLDHQQHILLLVLPLLTAGMTAFYMFRLWFLTFAGKPRDEHVREHAHESPAVMTVPLIVLAIFSVGVAWGWPIWDADESYLGKLLAKSEPAAVAIGFERRDPHRPRVPPARRRACLASGDRRRGDRLPVLWPHAAFSRHALRDRFAGLSLPLNKWYFDEVYDAAVVEPTVALARASAAADKRPTDAPPPTGEAELPPKRFDLLYARRAPERARPGRGIGRAVAANGAKRVICGSYVIALALTAALLLGILTALAGDLFPSRATECPSPISIWLSLLVFLPARLRPGALLFPAKWAEPIRRFALFGTAATLSVSLCVVVGYYELLDRLSRRQWLPALRGQVAARRSR